MNVLIAIDSFKGSLPSHDAAEAVKEAILSLDPDSNVKICPLADGGEGTVEALSYALGGKMQTVRVKGPLSQPVLASYCILNDGVTAVIEMASAAGISLVPHDRRNPLKTTTYGVGELIRDALSKGCTSFIIGIGGSATNDGGVGMLRALGFGFLDKNGNEIPDGAEGLAFLDRINTKNVIAGLGDAEFTVACDVDNPLCGENGCSAVFAPQKGADADDVSAMDKWLENYADIVKTVSPNTDKSAKGAGAAGGMGFALLSFTDAKLKSGVDIIIEKTGIESMIADADFVVTGEGRLDGQTVMGKAPSGIAALAKKHGKKVIAFSGCVANDAVVCNDCGIDAYFSILQDVCTSEYAMQYDNAYNNLKSTATQVFRLIKSLL